MKIKDLAFMTVVALLFSGCMFSDPAPKKPAMPKSSIESVNLPKDFMMDGSKFSLKQKGARTAEYYLPNENVGFMWSKLVSVTLDARADIKEYQKAFENALKSEQFGKAKFDFNFMNDKEYQGYTIYEPIASNPDFDNYEINLINVKRMECGLLIAHYALKYPSKTDKGKFGAIIKQKMPIFLKQMPRVDCK